MEILIWGDNMKRQVSVSIFLAILVIVLAWLYIKFNNETNPKESDISTENTVSKEEAITISQDYVTCQYFIKAEDGRLVVYDTKTQDLFMETGIEIKSLPADIQEKIESYIFFETERELYDFLESYSS